MLPLQKAFLQGVAVNDSMDSSVKVMLSHILTNELADLYTWRGQTKLNASNLRITKLIAGILIQYNNSSFCIEW